MRNRMKWILALFLSLNLSCLAGDKPVADGNSATLTAKSATWKQGIEELLPDGDFPRATNNLTVFSLTRGGTLMAPNAAGDMQKMGLSPLSTFGLSYANKLGGWDNSFSLSFTPSLNLQGANAAGPSSGAGQAPNLNWG